MAHIATATSGGAERRTTAPGSGAGAKGAERKDAEPPTVGPASPLSPPLWRRVTLTLAPARRSSMTCQAKHGAGLGG